jgi:hypothetical protein
MVAGIVDPGYRVVMKDAWGNLLTRKDLQNPEKLREVTGSLPDYRPEYTYERCAHLSLTALPFRGASVQKLLDRLIPGWDQYLDSSLPLERRSFSFSRPAHSFVWYLCGPFLPGWRTITCMFRASTCSPLWGAPLSRFSECPETK